MMDGSDHAPLEVRLGNLDIRIWKIRAVWVQSKGEGIRQQCQILWMEIQTVKEFVLLLFALIVIVVFFIFGNLVRVRVLAIGAMTRVRA